MKLSKRITVIIISVVLSISILASVQITAFSATNDEALISQADDKLTPLYTTAPDSSLKEHKTTDVETSKNYNLFYAETTVLALLAGYLIIFKAKGIDHSQKMHRRSKRVDED